MFYRVELTIPVVLTLTLGACATTTATTIAPGGPITGAPAGQNHGTLPNGFVAAHNSGADTVTLTIGGVAQTPLPQTATVNGLSFYDGNPGAAVFAIHGSFQEASFVVVSSPTSELGLAGTYLIRPGNATMPTTGMAYHDGPYAGFLVNQSDLAINTTVTGDAQLRVDFAAGTVIGDIHNRFVGISPAADLLLQSTTISSNAGFSGTATDGQIISPTASVTSGGTFSGLFAGHTGYQSVGAVSIDHTQSGSDYTEIGGFYAFDGEVFP